MKVELIDYMGSDMSVVNAARVSFAHQDDEGRTHEQNRRLINYLAKHKHWTPFGHTSVTLRVTAPIPIRTQAFKHKVGFVENEESRRYISYTPDIFYPVFRSQVDNKKQGSGGDLKGYDKLNALSTYGNSVNSAIRAYEELLRQGVAEEQARFVLPQGVMVNWYWTGSIAAFARFCKQRMDPHAQLEIQQLATMVDTEISELYPLSWAALMEN